jgi:hypothetical protein
VKSSLFLSSTKANTTQQTNLLSTTKIWSKAKKKAPAPKSVCSVENTASTSIFYNIFYCFISFLLLKILLHKAFFFSSIYFLENYSSDNYDNQQNVYSIKKWLFIFIQFPSFLSYLSLFWHYVRTPNFFCVLVADKKYGVTWNQSHQVRFKSRVKALPSILLFDVAKNIHES